MELRAILRKKDWRLHQFGKKSPQRLGREGGEKRTTNNGLLVIFYIGRE